MKKYTIAAIGELLWDVLPETEVIGGAPVNFAYHVTALGAKGIPISTIGRDARGEMALLELQKRGVDTSAISISDNFPTGYVLATVDSEGIASYSFPDEVAWDHLQVNDYAEKLRSTIDAVCFGSLAQRSPHSRRTIHGFLDSLGNGVVKVFDINIRQDFYSKEVVKSSLKRTDILKLNEDELPILAQLLELKGSGESFLPKLIERYQLKMLILSRGDKGSLLQTPEHSSEHVGIVTHVQDTIGAGDSYTAAAVIGWLQGLPLDEINEQANRIAAYVCSQQGGMPTMPQCFRQ